MYQCKHCKHPVHDYITEGINDWMQEAMVLLEDGTRLVGQFDSDHGHKVGNRETDSGGMWLHKICWETAGRPEFDAYEKPSKRMDELSYKDEELWIITPTVTDEAERERLLATGIKAHEGRMFDRRACDLDDLIERDPRWQTEEQKEFPWRQMFQVHGHGDKTQIYNRLNQESVPYAGAEEDSDAECKRLFEEFLASDECKALQARRAELSAKWHAEQMEKFKKEGRFEVGYRPSKKGGDVMNGREMDRTMFYVKDKLTYDDVVAFDFSDELAPKEYESDPEFDGNQSAEWEDRVEEFRTETGRIRALAYIECACLNAAWAEAGHPGEDWVLPV